MSKPLLAAVVFAGCAFVFLVAMAVRYSGAKDSYVEANGQWNRSRVTRQEFVNLSAQAPQDKGQAPKNFDVPSIMISLSEQLQIDTPQVSKQGAVRGQQRHSVTFPSQGLEVMGSVLLQMGKQFNFLTVRSIDASRSSGSDPATFKWTLQISSPPPK